MDHVLVRPKTISRITVVAVALLALLASLSASARILVLTSPPRESKQAGQALYGPFAAGLSKLWGVRVEYRHPPNWLQYQNAMRAGKYDIVFDGPHFAEWRVVHLHDHLTIKLPGMLVFYIVRHTNDTKITSLDDLIGKDICGIPPPNLATMTVITQYPNPARQPIIRGVHGGMPGVFKVFMAGQCSAAVLRSTFYTKKLTGAQRAKIKILFRSKPLPNQVITMSKRITPAQINQFMAWSTQPAGRQALSGIIKRFGGKAKGFIPATAKEYVGANLLLEGVIFGW